MAAGDGGLNAGGEGMRVSSPGRFFVLTKKCFPEERFS